MEIVKTAIDQVLILEPRVFEDARGYFFESFSQREFDGKVAPILGHSVTFVQDNESMSSYGVVRGLHYQRPPFAQSKHVRCVRGLGTLLNQSTRSLNAIAKAVREHGVDELDLLEAMEEAGRLQEITLTGVSEVREAEAAIMGRPTVRGW